MIDLADYSYELPKDRIAAQPLAERDRSKLLVCRVSDDGGSISHHRFDEIVGLIPADGMMIANDAKVVRARIILQKKTGGVLEFMLLDPTRPSHDPAVTLAATASCRWRCLIRSANRHRPGEISGDFFVEGNPATLNAKVVEEREGIFLVQFQWMPAKLSFAEVVEHIGRVPLPPYIRRQAAELDAGRYQTVYAERSGAVAAPTAGLHFTPEVLEELRRKGVRFQRVTLHVGAGTFRPIKEAVETHQMHGERVDVSLDTLREIIAQAKRRRDTGGAPFILIGTTSLRTVESLYWFGVRLLLGEARKARELFVGQRDPYRLALNALPGQVESLQAVLRWAEEGEFGSIRGETRIFIVPGYQVRLCDALLTNFHQPDSTLMLLVGALLGRELLHRVYDSALAEGYRFLSYGDCSLVVLGDDGRRTVDDGRRPHRNQ